MDQAVLFDDGKLVVEGFKVPDLYAPSDIKLEFEYGVFMGEIGAEPKKREGTTWVRYKYRHNHSGNSYLYDLCERDGQSVSPFFSSQVHSIVFVPRDGQEENTRQSFSSQFNSYPLFIVRILHGGRKGSVEQHCFNELTDIDLNMDGLILFVRSHMRGEEQVYQEISVPRKLITQGAKRILEL